MRSVQARVAPTYQSSRRLIALRLPAYPKKQHTLDVEARRIHFVGGRCMKRVVHKSSLMFP